MDVVSDTMGGDALLRAFETLRNSGIMVKVVAFPHGEAERYGVKVARSFTPPSARNLGEIVRLVEACGVMLHIEAVFPPDEERDALTLSEAGRGRGKIMLKLAG